VLLVPLALALGFVFTARAVTVVVEPPPDALAIRGGVVVPFAGRHLARPGRYVVVAELAGHHRLEEPIAVEAGADSIFRFELAPLPGRLRVLTTPSPAKIEIDGRAAGESPLDAVALEPGPHLVVVRAERHAPHQATVAIEGRDRLQTLEVELVPAFAPIGIRSEPPGATLGIYGEELGVTPLNVELGAGERSLALSLAGYETWTEEVTVVADRPEELPPVRLLPARGRLRLSSEPSGATVTVAGELRGRTPLTLALPPGEPTEVRLARAGHASAVRRVELASGEERALAVALEPVLGSVRVHATPEDALLLVDGEPRGAARQELELSAAPHRIEIRKPGYASYATSVTPKPGFAQELRVTLRTESDAALDRWPREIETPTGERLRLFEPG
jgi:hypothetical protein